MILAIIVQILLDKGSNENNADTTAILKRLGREFAS
jgi:hypothetical protein